MANSRLRFVTKSERREAVRNLPPSADNKMQDRGRLDKMAHVSEGVARAHAEPQGKNYI